MCEMVVIYALVRSQLRHNEIKRLLTLIGVTPQPHFATNTMLLTNELNTRGYDGDVNYKAIRGFLTTPPEPPPPHRVTPYLPPPPTPVTPYMPNTLENQSDERIKELMLLTYSEDNLYGIDRVAAIDTIDWDLRDAHYHGPDNYDTIYWFIRGTQLPGPIKVSPYNKSSEYITRLDGKMFDDIMTENERLRVELRANKDRMKQLKVTIMKQKMVRDDDDYFRRLTSGRVQARAEADEEIQDREQLQQQILNQRHIDVLMGTDTTTNDHKTQLTQEERVQRRENTLETTGRLLTGVYDKGHDKEITVFINNHGFTKIDCNGYIPLFKPQDQPRFDAIISSLKQKPNTTLYEDHNVFVIYLINSVTSIKRVFEYLDTVYEKHKSFPFKLIVNAGFILEQDCGDGDVEYKIVKVYDYDEQRSIPVVISKPADVELYKHYLYSYITEKSEVTHLNSSNRYVAIIQFCFKVVLLNRTGKTISKIKPVKGYEFILHRNDIRTISVKNNLCFCAFRQ